MATEVKQWEVEHNHRDGRSGTIKATTEIGKSGAFEYGNGKCGLLTVGDYEHGYDLRYCMADDLHMVMLEDYFGKGLVKATEI